MARNSTAIVLSCVVLSIDGVIAGACQNGANDEERFHAGPPSSLLPILTGTLGVLALTVVGLVGDDGPRLHLGNQTATIDTLLSPAT